jgi:prolyl-tRNA editing enzyme YbaK/EbsC (Cys-tRNA(Pro) deacylase)
MSTEKLEAYLRKEGVDAKVLTFKKHTMSVEDAERQLGVGRERIIKSMLFVDEKGVPLVGIVTGDKKVSEEKLVEACGALTIKVALSSAVKSLTGFEAGALPPVGYKRNIRTFIDPKVMTFNKVYGGGGAINARARIRGI